MSSPVKGCEFSVRYVWNGAGARFRWNIPCLERKRNLYDKKAKFEEKNGEEREKI